MDSVTRADGVNIELEFKWGQDTSVKAVEARGKIDAIRADLPSDLTRYQVFKFATSDQPVLQLRISSEHDLTNSYELIDRELKRPLERLPGVAQVKIEGVSPREVQIEIDSDRLTAAGVGLNDLYKRLVDGELLRVGRADQGWRPALSRAAGRRVAHDRGRAQHGRQRQGPQAQRRRRGQHQARASQLCAPSGPASRGRGRHFEGTQRQSRRGRAQRDRRGRAHPPAARDCSGIQIYALGDQAQVGHRQPAASSARRGSKARCCRSSCCSSSCATGRRRSMVSLAIPICFVITLGCMQLFGMTLNMLSMMGLLLAVGMLVDNAVVVVESIYHYRERYPDKPWYCAVQGTQVVGIAIAAGTLSSIIVFLPMVFGEKDNISIFLTQVAVTMAIAHLASWLVAVSLVPMLSAKLPPPKFIGRKNIITRMQGGYATSSPHAAPSALDDGRPRRAARDQRRAAGCAHESRHVSERRSRSLFLNYRLNAPLSAGGTQEIGRRGRRLSRRRIATSSTSRTSTAATPKRARHVHVDPVRRRDDKARSTRRSIMEKTAQGDAEDSDRRGHVRLRRQRSATTTRSISR